MAFIEKIRSALESLSPRRRYLVGVSGGVDSMVLLTALKNLGYKHLVVCHFSHGLRPAEAEGEANLVAEAAMRANFAFEHGAGDTGQYAHDEKKSIETAARELRLDFFQTCARTHRCRRIFLAHHADDQVETILNNLFRGTGLAGLGGMRNVSHIGRLDMIRPLLGVSRADIISYAKAENIAFAEDATNAVPAHTRNKIRLHLLPAIEKIFGSSAREAVLRMADIAQCEDSFLSMSTPKPEQIILTKNLRPLHPALRRRALAVWLREAGIEAGFAEITAVDSLLNVDNPAKINLPSGLHARRRAGKIFIEKVKKSKKK